MTLVPTVQASDITVKVNGEEIHPEMAPVIVEERTLVPLRAVSEALGCDVSWDADTKGITLCDGSNLYFTWIDKDHAFKTSSTALEDTTVMDVSPTILNDYTMVPLRAISEMFGATVNWDGGTSFVTFDYTKKNVEEGLAKKFESYEKAFAEKYDAYKNYSDDTGNIVRAEIQLEDGGNIELELYPDMDIYITQGFICRNAYGEIDNLQRGGSDYTASLIGAAVNASEIQIWTDIDGMHNNDPRIVDKTAPVRQLHFEEAAELAYFGAKILHPTCIQPAKYANIPVRLLNTMDPTAPGTLISNDTEKGKIKAVAAKDNITAIKIKSSRMLLAHGFLRKVFEIFESYQTSIDMICTSEVGVSVTIDNTKHLNEILDDLKKYGTVTVDKEMCIICVVGDLEWENVGFEAKALDAMRDIPVRMISFGGSNYNISFLIRECDKKAALQSLSDMLFNGK